MGEVVENTITCFRCKLDLPIDDFYERKESKKGHRGVCKKCTNKRRDELAICGIYSITSPTGKIYVGQSVSIKARWSSYRTRMCENQPILHRSFKKYGVNNHIFKVLEECDISVLNSRENYWQIELNTVSRNGLNCLYVTEEDFERRRKKRETKASKKIRFDVIDVETGVFYYSLKEASDSCNIKPSVLYNMLIGRSNNITNLIRSDDYEIGKKPSELYRSNSTFMIKGVYDEMLIIDYISGNIVGSTAEVAKKIGVVETTLRSYLKGYANNKTNYIYKKDYDAGKTPWGLCSNIKQKVPLLNTDTAETYESIIQASKSLNLCKKSIGEFLAGKNNKEYPLLKI